MRQIIKSVIHVKIKIADSITMIDSTFNFQRQIFVLISGFYSNTLGNVNSSVNFYWINHFAFQTDESFSTASHLRERYEKLKGSEQNYLYT